jgi:acetoin utilization deacetylase AcuC-like enzyme
MFRLNTHRACLRHVPPSQHAECPARLHAVLAALDADRYATLDCVEAPRASREQLLRMHDAAHIDAILSGPPSGSPYMLDADTYWCADSAEAALRAAGAVIAAVDAVMTGTCRHAFCAVRPPGHHATATHAMGFCLFNNVALGAAHALAVHGLERIAIADFDVHHGNGTQELCAGEARVLFASSHQLPLYPGTGDPDAANPENCINGALAPGAGSTAFRALWSTLLLPRLHAFRPQLVLVSAGFDAHRRDPLAELQLEVDDYIWITAQLVELAHAYAADRLVSTLEGGYDLPALAASTCAHVDALMA